MKKMVRNQASIIPKATKIPKTWTGGMGVRAKDAKPADEVKEVNSMGLKSSSMTYSMVCFRL